MLTQPATRGPAPAGRVVLLVTSRRVAPGLLTWQAWQTLRDAARVLCGDAGHPQAPALAAAGIGCETVPAGTVGLAGLLAQAAAESPGPVAWLADLGEPPARPDDQATALLQALRALPGGPAAEVLYGSQDLPGAHLLDLVATMDMLRTRCPWDAKQTHESLAPHLLEEPYEALEALEGGDHLALREELGDVLLQVLFHARIAAERGDGTGYTIDDVADGIVAKLVRRHPHVFGGVTVSGADEVKRNWDAIKRAERAAKAQAAGEAQAGRAGNAGDAEYAAVTAAAVPSVLDGVPFGQPALALAAQLQRRAARGGVPDDVIGGDGPARDDAPGGRDLGGSDRGAEPSDSGTELGDTLFALVARARQVGLDAELELRAAARRFRDRVHAWEQTHRPAGDAG